MDPLVFRNRSFLTIATATILSFFAQMAMMLYFPMFLQGVQGISTTNSGLIFTPLALRPHVFYRRARRIRSRPIQALQMDGRTSWVSASSQPTCLR